MLKWACLIMLILDILLFGAAGYRLLTVPDDDSPVRKSAVQATDQSTRRPPTRAEMEESIDPMENPADAEDPGAVVDQQQENLDDAKAKIRERFGGGN
ncbi:hypothetical protein KQI84_09625 [bacterium]|nr:hypothetical protein [bacterium]